MDADDHVPVFYGDDQWAIEWEARFASTLSRPPVWPLVQAGIAVVSAGGLMVAYGEGLTPGVLIGLAIAFGFCARRNLHD